MNKLCIAVAIAAVMNISAAACSAANLESAAGIKQPTQNMTVDIRSSAAAESKAVNDKKATADQPVKAVQLEYTKKTFVFQGSGETIVTETWMDPETLENRTNEIATSATGKVGRNTTYYTKDGAKHHINFFRDQSGKAVSGQEFYFSQERAAESAKDLRKYDTFAGRKAMYTDMEFWQNKGKVTLEGKSVNKLLRGDKKRGNSTCVYVDTTTGFPVKEENFVNGKLNSKTTYEFKMVDRDEKLFDTSREGVKPELQDTSKSNPNMDEKKKKQLIEEKKKQKIK